MSAAFSPTPEQREAIESRGGALLISAGAGSGKTRVLTERLMSYLTDEREPRDVDDFLIITYTRAAAGELRSRIIGTISERLRDDPNNRRLRRQAVLAHRAEIDTIHSFCGGIARENAHTLGISPDFRIAEESECAAIKAVAAERVLEARYANLGEYEGFSELVDTVSPGRDDSRLVELLIDTYGRLRSHYDGKRRTEEQLEALRLGASSDVSETPWGAFMLKKARRAAGYWRDRAAETLGVLFDDDEGYRIFGACFEYVLSAAEMFLEAALMGWDAAAASASFTFPRAKPCKPGMYDGIKAKWERCRAGLRELEHLFPASSAELASDMSAVYPVTAALLHLVYDFAEEYLKEKKRRRIVDFSDLEHFALELLRDRETGAPTALAEEISARYVEIMVDEYQDVSELQERIFATVSRGGRNLAAVGDARQSIYRFRLAEPSIFIEKYKTFGDGGGTDAPGRRVILSQNFRSREAIINAVNYVFGLVMSEEFGELDYTEREYLASVPGREGGEPVELAVLTASAEEEEGADEAADEDSRPAPGKREYEARFIAERMRELIESGFMIPDGESTRRADYSDVAILLRAKKHASVYRDALRRLGIPVRTPEAEAFFERPEIETALALLTVIDNPRDDTALIAALRSPVYAFTPDELAEIRLSLPDGDFYDALSRNAEGGGKSADFLKELREFRALAPELGAERTLWMLYGKTGLPELVGAEENGAERRAGLRRLIEQARRAASIGRFGVFDFLLYVKTLREHGAETSAETSEGGGAVRIMTAHKSKGLEFPIVFLADMSRRFNLADSRERMLFHRELGAGPKRVDLERRVEYPTLPRLAIAKKLADETMSEELRVLYVAMTRAREKLIITYAANGAEDILEKLAADLPLHGGPVPPYMLSRQRSIGDILLLAALTRPEARALLGGFAYASPEDGWRMRLIRAGRDGETAPPVGGTEKAEENADGGGRNSQESSPEPPASPFVYAYPKAPELPSKLTVTELKNRLADAETREDAEIAIVPGGTSPPRAEADAAESRDGTPGQVYARPRFIAGPGGQTADRALTGAERGTALHLAMSRIPLRDYAGADELKRELDALAEAGYLDARQREAADENKILRFLRSEHGVRAARASEVYREFKFSIFVPAETYFPGGGSDEIMLQGVVDLAFREGEDIVIVDFKTDRVRNGDALREKTALYTPQIAAYMRAMERVAGLRAREGIIYFFDVGKAVEVPSPANVKNSDTP